MSGAFNRELLSLARESRGVTQQELAAGVGTTQGRISKIENGILEPPDELVAQFSRFLDYPVSFFHQPESAVGLPAWFYRKRKSLPKRTQYKIAASVNIGRLQVARLLRSADIEHGWTIPQLDIDEYGGDAAGIAREVRGHWHLPHGPIPNLVAVLERAGAIVIPTQFGTDKVDAIAMSLRGTPPLIFTSSAAPTDRLRFSLAHELGHLVMHTGTPSPEMEQEADEFASEFLMPATDIASELPPGLRLGHLAALKPIWRTSMAALLVRAQRLGRIGEKRYRQLWVEMGRRGWRRREPPELDLRPESPSALQGLLDFHMNELGYSIDELAASLHEAPRHFARRYSSHKRLRVISN